MNTILVVVLRYRTLKPGRGWGPVAVCANNPLKSIQIYTKTAREN